MMNSIDSEQPLNLMPLGRVWEFPSHQASALMAEINRRFCEGRLSIYGRRPCESDRKLIRFPLDYRIDWLGHPSPRGDYCAPRAVGISDLSAPSNDWPTQLGKALCNRTEFEDLAAPQEDYTRILHELGFAPGASEIRDELLAETATILTSAEKVVPVGRGMEDPSPISIGIGTLDKRLKNPMPIVRAIERRADRLGATKEQAWAEIKSKAFYGRLSLVGIDDKGRLCELEPYWISYISAWGIADPSPASVSARAGSLTPPENQPPSTSDMPRPGGFIEFDRERAIRDWRSDKKNGRAPRSIPPLRIRDVLVDGAEFDDLSALAEDEFQKPERADQTSGAFMPTGAPGRPTKGMHLIRAEFEQRLGENACKSTLREEATELQLWYCRNYPKANPPTIKTIENNLRSGYRQQHLADNRSI
jgi:hypothetical protein